MIPVLVALTPSIGFAADLIPVDVALGVRHVVGGVDSFDRSVYLNIHAHPNEPDWTGDWDKRDEFILRLKGHFGRETGAISSALNTVREDPNRPGYADPDHISELAARAKALARVGQNRPCDEKAAGFTQGPPAPQAENPRTSTRLHRDRPGIYTGYDMSIGSSTLHSSRWPLPGTLALCALMMVQGCGGSEPAPPTTPNQASEKPLGLPPAPSAEEVAQKLSDETIARMDAMCRDSADKVNKDADALEEPFPWMRFPGMIRTLVKKISGKPNEHQLWLDHGRRLSIPLTYLADAVSKVQSDPNAPFLLTINQQRPRQDSFERSVREIGQHLSRPLDEVNPGRSLLGVLYLILSGDTREAGEILDKLPPSPTDPALGVQDQLLRILAKTLLRWGTKGEPTPTTQAVEGLKFLSSHPDDARNWDIGLIIAYGSMFSTFHSDYGIRAVNRDYFDRVLNLVGRGPDGPGVIPKGTMQYIIDDVRFYLWDQTQKGIKEYAPLITGSAPKANAEQVAAGTDVARYNLTLANLGRDRELGPMWFNLVGRWMVPLTRMGLKKLGPSMTDAANQQALSALEATARNRKNEDKSGVVLAVIGALEALAGKMDAARSSVEAGSKLAKGHAYTADDEEVHEFMEDLGALIQ